MIRQLVEPAQSPVGSPSPARAADAGDAGDGVGAELTAGVPDALVRKHFLAPLAYRAGVERFRGDYIASSLLAELRARHLDEVSRALMDAGVAMAPIKGVAYLGRIYTDPAERPMSDIDLLVPPAQHARASEVLRRLGFWRVGSPRQHSRLHHAVGYKRKGVSVDLHRSIVQPWRSRIDIGGLWRRALPLAVDGSGARPAPARGGEQMPAAGLYRLDPVDELVVHLGHIARHELMVPAVNYIDAARLLATVELPAVYRRAGQFRVARGVRAALAMTHTLTGWPRALAPLSARRTLQASPREVLGYRTMWRPLQLVRKLSLVDGPAELVGLLAVGVYDGLAHRLRP
ncbi:MAG: hypothetical protein Tsb0020_49870 [Haliangiales bacterium]